MNVILPKINHPKELRRLSRTALPQLAFEMREFILDTLSVKPGHLGASLGVVELTIALHYYFQTPEDLLIWDVGHQCYPHKLLTERAGVFHSLRQLNGLAGFPSRDESEFDIFGTGHSSTSISAIVGMAAADRIKKIERNHIAVIGDASIASGMSFEALNHLGATDLNVLVILNDNAIGIDPSIGGLKQHLKTLDYQEDNLFTDLGLCFLGSIDGHNFDELFDAFDRSKAIAGPKILRVRTTKGKGYQQAELDQVKWHSPGLFNKETGEIKASTAPKSFQTVFSETMLQLLTDNPSIVALTPAMLTGSNLTACAQQFPERVLDVGIAEQHAVTFSAGLATQGIIPYCTIYSTFLQRAYDQVIHDVALQHLPVVFCIDRAGLVGTDGATHHGYFDLAFLRQIPNMVVSSPRNEEDFRNLLYTAQFTQQPFAIRFPKSTVEPRVNTNFQQLPIGKAYTKNRGGKVAVLTNGVLGNKIQTILEQDPNLRIGWYDFPFVKPLDKNKIKEIAFGYQHIFTLEDGIVHGGFGTAILEEMNRINYSGKIECLGYPDAFIPHGSVDELHQLIGLSTEEIKKKIDAAIEKSI